MNTKTVYLHDCETKRYKGTAEAFERSDGTYQYPMNAVDLKPPDPKGGIDYLWDEDPGVWVEASNAERRAAEAAQEKESADNDDRIYLYQTDWYVIREWERKIPVPLEITAKREEAATRIGE